MVLSAVTVAIHLANGILGLILSSLPLNIDDDVLSALVSLTAHGEFWIISLAVVLSIWISWTAPLRPATYPLLALLALILIHLTWFTPDPPPLVNNQLPPGYLSWVFVTRWMGLGHSIGVVLAVFGLLTLASHAVMKRLALTAPLIGWWWLIPLLCVTELVSGVVGIADVRPIEEFDQRFSHSMWLVVFSLEALAWAGLAWWLAILWRRYRRSFTQSHCPQCRYNLSMSSECGCPECGWNRAEAGA